jgi:AcrR family transcriptional regulator
MLGLLMDRDARSMAVEHQAALRTEVGGIVHRLSAVVACSRPELDEGATDLLARSLFAVFMSPSFHHLALPRGEYETLLSELALRVVFAPIEGFDTTSQRVVASPLTPVSRREAVLSEATRLFARNGYAGVSLEDIGASLGIAGSSVYNHVESKADILVTSLRRSTAYLMLDLNRILSSTRDPAEALTGLIDSYVEMMTTHTDVLDLLITQIDQLPAEERHEFRQIQHDYIAEWTHLIEESEPDLDPTAARIQVQTVLTVVNDTCRTPHLLAAAGFAEAIRIISRSLLFGA